MMAWFGEGSDRNLKIIVYKKTSMKEKEHQRKRLRSQLQGNEGYKNKDRTFIR